jgi:hypothetical protein
MSDTNTAVKADAQQVDFLVQCLEEADSGLSLAVQAADEINVAALRCGIDAACDAVQNTIQDASSSLEAVSTEEEIAS